MISRWTSQSDRHVPGNWKPEGNLTASATKLHTTDTPQSGPSQVPRLCTVPATQTVRLILSPRGFRVGPPEILPPVDGAFPCRHMKPLFHLHIHVPTENQRRFRCLSLASYLCRPWLNGLSLQTSILVAMDVALISSDRVRRNWL